jgi:hypothetical protein
MLGIISIAETRISGGAMTDSATVIRELEGWILDAVHKTNAVTYEALKVMTDAVKPVTAAIPTVTPPLAYDFVEQLVATERKFAEDVLRLSAQLRPAKAAQGK